MRGGQPEEMTSPCILVSAATVLKMIPCLELLGAQAEAVPGALHDGAAGRAPAAHQQRDADHTVAAHHRDLGRGALTCPARLRSAQSRFHEPDIYGH